MTDETSDDGPDRTGHDPGVSVVLRERRHLVHLAYRLLGSLAEAEDAVHETYARWYAMPPSQRDAIASPRAWLTTVASRVCLDVLGSARVRRECYVGEWVPEPLPATAAGISVRGGVDGSIGDPADRVTLDESVTMAFLVTLEAMTPAERVALILHDVFGYTFPEVAGVVGRTPAACRQLASSARRRARAARPPATPRDRQATTVRAFLAAWQARDIDALLGVLDQDATAVVDGGGLAPAVLAPLRGSECIARHYVTIAEGMPDDATTVECTVNGEPGLVMRQGGVTVTVFAFAVADDRITRIWAVRNPEKLRPWTGSGAPGVMPR